MSSRDTTSFESLPILVLPLFQQVRKSVAHVSIHTDFRLIVGSNLDFRSFQRFSYALKMLGHFVQDIKNELKIKDQNRLEDNYCLLCETFLNLFLFYNFIIISTYILSTIFYISYYVCKNGESTAWFMRTCDRPIIDGLHNDPQFSFISTGAMQCLLFPFHMYDICFPIMLPLIQSMVSFQTNCATNRRRRRLCHSQLILMTGVQAYGIWRCPISAFVLLHWCTRTCKWTCATRLGVPGVHPLFNLLFGVLFPIVLSD